MDLNPFKKHVQNSALSADFESFIKEVEKVSGIPVPWNKICHDKSGDTVAHLAAGSGCVGILKYFHETEQDAILEQKNFDGKTPLHVAVQSSQLESVKYLLHCNVAIDALKRADWTPLMLACTKDNTDIIKVLLSHGANLWCRNKDGWTAFHIAAREGNIDVISCLLQNDSSVWNTTSKNGRTPLHTAALHGHLNTVKKILSYNCDKDVQDSCGTTSLMDAASGNHRHVIEYLIEIEKVDVQNRDMLGRTVLHLAAQAGSLECIEYLVTNCSIDVNQKTNDGMTVLHFAAKENNVKCMKLLLELGADPLSKDKKGRLAEEYLSKEK